MRHHPKGGLQSRVFVLLLVSFLALASPLNAVASNVSASQLPPDSCNMPVNSDQSGDTVDEASQMTVILDQAINSKTSHKGDTVYARLGSHLTFQGHDFAPGSTVVGKLTEVDKARRNIKADISPKRWLQTDGALGMEFDQVTDETGQSANICGVPMAMSKQFRQAVQEESIAVSKNGVVHPPRTDLIAPKVTRLAIGAAGTLLHCPVVPLVGGCIGALAPSLVLSSSDRQYQSEVKHRRLKGFATGAIAGMPGGFLVNETLLKGRDEVLQPGTVLLVRVQPSAVSSGAI